MEVLINGMMNVFVEVRKVFVVEVIILDGFLCIFVGIFFCMDFFDNVEVFI